MRISAFLALVALVACHRGPLFAPDVPPPNPEIPATAGDIQVCAHLAELGCREAWPSGGACIELMTQARTDSVYIPIVCLGAARTQADVRACGSADTLTFRCGGP